MAIVFASTLALIFLRAALISVLESLFVHAHVQYGRIVFVPGLDAFRALSVFTLVDIRRRASINESIIVAIIATLKLLNEIVEPAWIAIVREAMSTINALIGLRALDPVYELFLVIRDTDVVIRARDKSDGDILDILKWDKFTNGLTLEPLVKRHKFLESVNQGILLLVLICLN